MLKITPELKQDEFDELLSFVSEEKRERIVRYHFFQDARNCLLADVLSRIKICRENGLHNKELNFSTDQYRKPFLLNYPHIHFNVSHTGNYITCVTSNEPIGIDIETIRHIDFRIAERFFSKDEILYIMTGRDIIRFYEIWTKKESFIKWKGKGLYMSMNSFCVLNYNEPEKPNYYKIFQNHEIVCHLCSTKDQAPCIGVVDTATLMKDVAILK